MKRSLITATGLLPFTGGITTVGSCSHPKKPTDSRKDLHIYLRQQSTLSSFPKTL